MVVAGKKEGRTHVVVDSTKVRVMPVVVGRSLVIDDAEELILVKRIRIIAALRIQSASASC